MSTGNNEARDGAEQHALDKLFDDYPEICDPDFAFLTDKRLEVLEAAGYSRADAIAMAGEEIADKFGLRRHSAPQLDHAPSASSIIEEMRRSRLSHDDQREA